MLKRGTKNPIKSKLVSRETKRDDVGSKTILKQPEPMKFDIRIIKGN